MSMYVWKCRETGTVIAVIAESHVSALEAVNKQTDDPRWHADFYKFIGEFTGSRAAIVRPFDE